MNKVYLARIILAAGLFCVLPALAGPNEDLSEAIRKGSGVQAEQALLSGADPNLEIPIGYMQTTRLLPWAVKFRNFKLASLALEKGAKINARDAKGRTLLHLILYQTHLFETPEKYRSNQTDVQASLDLVHWLLSKGADPSLKDHQGKTAVDLVSALREDLRQRLERAHENKYFTFQDQFIFEFDKLIKEMKLLKR